MASDGSSNEQQDISQSLSPYAQLDSDPPTQYVQRKVQFDASKSHDGDKQPVVKYVFDFGDGSPKVTTPKPVVYHQYDNTGSYPVSVEVTDKCGMTAEASLTQRVIDPNAQDPTLPYAAVSSTPKDPKPRDPVKFDASKSIDCDGDPVKKYLWDFGDGTPLKTTHEPKTQHQYENPGTFSVAVTVTDKYGKSSGATCRTMIVPPPDLLESPPARLPPTVILRSKSPPTMLSQTVHFDASDSHDYQGNPCVSYKWDFGDCKSQVTTTEPYAAYQYTESGTYPVRVISTDKFQQTGEAS